MTMYKTINDISIKLLSITISFLSALTINAQEGESYLVTVDSFRELGTWKLESSGVFGEAIMGKADRATAKTKPAWATIDVKEAGTYKVWVHARDYSYSPGTRFFSIAVNGKESDEIFGDHGVNGYEWELAGEFVLNKGVTRIELIDKSAFYARCDAIFLTKDSDYIPSNEKELLVEKVGTHFPTYSDTDIGFPKWAIEEGIILKKDSIMNDKVKVVYIKKKNTKGNVYIQNEIYVYNQGKWIKTKDKNEEFGILSFEYPNNLLASFTDGYMINNIYKKGRPTWLIPNDYKKVTEDKIIVGFPVNNNYTISFTWNLGTETNDIKIDLNAIFSKEGNYSFVLFNGREYTDAEYQSALSPFRIMQRRVPKEATVFMENYLTTPMGSVTLPKNNSITKDEEFTTAVVIAPESIRRGFVYPETATYGVVMRGPGGGIRGNIVAPAIGSERATFKAGESFNFSYYIINTVGDWFENYKYIAEKLFEINDYRSNYYTSLNEAIYNTTDLMMDDENGGWDSADKAFYNMEEKDLTSVANPMMAVQRYLLTESDSILHKRAVPTIASLLTRHRLHFKRFDTKGGANYLGNIKKPTSIGKPIEAYNLNVYGGLYEMSRGMIPALLNIGMERSGKVNNSYGSIPPFVNDLSLYHYTKDESHLKAAIEKADKYLEDIVYGDEFNSELPGIDKFIYISYYPNIASLLDIYEVTKEQRYLDAARKAGELLCSTLWVSGGIDGKKRDAPYLITQESVTERPYMVQHDFFWYGSNKRKVGFTLGNNKVQQTPISSIVSEEVPGWVPSRVGLGIEQGSTFTESLNIYMNSWVGDLLKLASYTGEEYFYVVAKNAIIGRFATYSGYYHSRYMTHQMKPDYAIQGPDYSSLYWHHIPPFLTMLEDFLINQVFYLSKRKIHFPSVRQQGYAYFNSNQYGFAPGCFYDIDGVWLWNDRGIIDIDSKDVNYLPARKDGVLTVSFINEAYEEKEIVVGLGEKIEGGNQYNGVATIYDEEGRKTRVPVLNGTFKLRIPSKRMRSASLNIDSVKSPAYAVSVYNNDIQKKRTVTEHNYGKAYIIQFDPYKYSVYLYVTKMRDDIDAMKVTYKVGKAILSKMITEYPFEVIIDIDSVEKDFQYDLELIKDNRTVEFIKGGRLEPINKK